MCFFINVLLHVACFSISDGGGARHCVIILCSPAWLHIHNLAKYLKYLKTRLQQIGLGGNDAV
jgi:hypothetical protein